MKKKNEDIINSGKIDLTQNLEKSIKDFSIKVDGFVYPLIIPPVQSIDEDILFEIYPDLRKIGKQKKLHILLYSYGGDAHRAFHISRLLQENSDELIIYILREAKSAATLISCAADKIIFSDISELGPMDPQIRSRIDGERFSPLAIKHTFDLLQEESQKGHHEIVKSLTSNLPSPLILGEHLKSLETGKDYLIKLMSARMFKGVDEEKVKEIAEELVTGYPDHGYCIDFKEAKKLGLKVEHVSKKLENDLFIIMREYKSIWDQFDRHMNNVRGAHEEGNTEKEENELEQAVYLYRNLKTLAINVITFQREKEKKKTTKQKNKIIK